MSYLKSVGTVFIYIGLFLAVITFIPGLPPDTEFQEYRYCDVIENKDKKRKKCASRGDPD